MGEHVQVGSHKIWTEQVGTGPDVLLIGGLGDTVESWRFQLDRLTDRYRLTAFDSPGGGRTAMLGGKLTVEMLADDTARLLRTLGIPIAHVAGFSEGSIIAQELAIRHPELVRSLILQSTWLVPDICLRTFDRCVRWMVETAPGEREFLEALYLYLYTARAHNDGTVERIIGDVLNFPHKHGAAEMLTFLEAIANRDAADRLHMITAPTLVLAGGADRVTRPKLGREVAGRIRGARFEVMSEEGHQPFQEACEKWNARVDAFWRQVGNDASTPAVHGLGAADKEAEVTRLMAERYGQPFTLEAEAQSSSSIDSDGGGQVVDRRAAVPDHGRVGDVSKAVAAAGDPA
ncbi:alpha/beta fold hydrolase [Arthrobacter crystallopoietes]|uniref:alpha/beta fold hydrolase n=1 Tax=Crystallibacter crystallopoietes TaxID=37928 RepID=UPI001ABDE02F|nr:alpha/beta hydrolase [Arthrobacter crystallopoietes]QTG79552.1 alpha/beta fold hydrolase [Arthrobacter crystallopoietes]